jgi:hypothetical protein
MEKNKIISRFVIGTFVTLYLLVSIISTIHVIDFFKLSNPYWLAVTLAIGFEIGAAASLASLVILKKMNKTLVWALFLAITIMQMQGNMYYAFINLDDYTSWSELFNLIEEDIIFQKRVLSFVSGAILPLIALGFIKSLVDYIKPEEDEEVVSEGSLEEPNEPVSTEEKQNQENDIYDDFTDWDSTINDGLEDEEWDEDHALDQVLNDMVKDMDVNDFNDVSEEVKLDGWDGFTPKPFDIDTELADTEDEELLEEYSETKANDREKFEEDEEIEINPTSVGSIVQKIPNHLLTDDSDAIKKALKLKAEQDKKDFIKSKENDKENLS